jgi:hypothetical protein
MYNNSLVKMVVFWVVAPCSLVEVYQRFRGPCCLHHQGDESYLLLPDYTALQPRRQPSSYSPPWEPQILQFTSDLLSVHAVYTPYKYKYVWNPVHKMSQVGTKEHPNISENQHSFHFSSTSYFINVKSESAMIFFNL